MNKRVLVATGCMFALALGCAEIYGLGDYSQQDGSIGADAGDSGTTPDVSFIDGFIYDAWTDGGVGCPGACVPSIPSGWTAIGYDQAFRPNCASLYGTSIDVEEGLTAGPATCGCSCGLSTAACSSLLVTAGDGGTNTCNNQSSQAVTWDGGSCTTIGAISTQNEKMSVTASGSGGCAPDASVVKPNVNYAYQGRMCQLLAAPSSGCEAGVCVPDPAPYVSCVYQAGAVACPSGYPVQHNIGTQLDDTRGCSACTCGYDGGGGCGGNAIFYTGGACNASSQSVTVNGTCQSVTNQTFKSMTYQPSTGTATCTPSSVSATGTATFQDPATVCCTQ